MAAIEAGEAIVHGAVEITPVFATFAVGAGLLGIACSPGQTVDLSWWQNTYVQPGGNDEAQMGIAFLDSGAAEIAPVTWSALAQPTAWTQRTVSAAAPAGTVAIRIYMGMHRLAGSHNDGYIDDVALTIDGFSIPLSNSGAESGTSWWTNVTGAIDVTNNTLGSPGTPAPHSGTFFFAGGNNVDTQAYYPSADAPGVLVNTLRFWSGHGNIEIGGNVFLGLGDRSFVQQSAGAIGGVAQGLNIGLSGIEPNVLTLMEDVASFRGASVVVYRLIFKPGGKIPLDAHIFDRGRIDTIQSDETVGGPASIVVAMESAARGLGRSLARMRSDADQRLISSLDGYFSQTAYAPEKELYWGGPRPVSTGDAHGGAVAGTIGGTGDGF